MKAQYNFPIIENCANCQLRKQGWFCALSSDLLRSFSTFSRLTTYPAEEILFRAGDMPRGGIILCSGKVKLSTTSKEGKVLVLKVAMPGEIIGLSAVLSGEPYEITAETVGPCVINVVEKDGLLRLMERSGELGLRSALAVSREFQRAYRDIHDFVLSRSCLGKLARLLLSRVRCGIDSTNEVRIQAPFTHQEMAHRIGVSRESVTRSLSELRRKDLIKREGSTWIIKNLTALEAMAV
jgi:CRP/FNR family transcriptional regulator